MQRKVLFMVGSMYQLMNAITLRMTEMRDEDCDLILRSSTQWSEEILQRLQEKGIFGRITCPDLTEQEASFWYKSIPERQKLVEDPLLFFGQEPVAPEYDVLFLGVAHMSWKLIYRYHCLLGKRPEVYFFDEGVRSYTLDQYSHEKEKYLQNDYQQTRLIDAVVGYYLYRPEWYCVNNCHYELLQLPNPSEHQQVKQTLIDVFGRMELPREPYIYLEDFFFVDRHVSNDFSLFTALAGIVGKENITVKRHPRDDHDRFAPHGYHVMENSVVPWEIQLLSNDLSRKVLVSVSSTSMMTPFFIFNSRMHIISLEKMFTGNNPLHADKGFKTFFDRFVEEANMHDTIIHLPRTPAELQETIRYIKLLQNERINTLEG